MKKRGAPARAGAVIDEAGIVHIEASGARRNGEADQVTVQDRWHLGSNTKAMTAALYARLVEAGRADWDAPLAELLPDLKIDPAWSEVTLQELLAHRSGLLDGALLNGAWLKASRTDTRALDVQRRAFAERALAAPPKGRPGAFAYSNAGYMIAGAVIERLTGGTWEAAMREHVFEPLAMESAGFGAPTGDNAWGHSAPPFIGGLVRPKPMDPADPAAENPLAIGPAGTVHADLVDYGKFLRVFLTDGGGFLKSETVARLVRPVGKGGQPYALGWGVTAATPWTQGDAYLHEGSNTMWRLMAVVAPKRGVAVVAATNAGPQVSLMAVPMALQDLQRRFVP